MPNHIKVRDLIERLAQADPNAHVKIKNHDGNQAWPEFDIEMVSPSTEVVLRCDNSEAKKFENELEDYTTKIQGFARDGAEKIRKYMCERHYPETFAEELDSVFKNITNA